MKVKKVFQQSVFWAIWIGFALLYLGGVSLHSTPFTAAGLGIMGVVCLLAMILY